MNYLFGKKQSILRNFFQKKDKNLSENIFIQNESVRKIIKIFF